MATYFVYSVEALPRTDLFESRDYNPATDYIGYNGIYLSPIPAKIWTQIPDRFKSLRHRDRQDKAGTAYHVFADEIVKANEHRLRDRGVVFLDHEPTPAEKATLEAQAEKLNLAFRMTCVQQYEEALKEAEANGRTAKCLTYTQECYKLLGMERPGSVEALRAQRQPGEASAERFAKAIEDVFQKLMERMSAAKEVANEPKTTAGGRPAPVSRT